MYIFGTVTQIQKQFCKQLRSTYSKNFFHCHWLLPRLQMFDSASSNLWRQSSRVVYQCKEENLGYSELAICFDSVVTTIFWYD